MRLVVDWVVEVVRVWTWEWEPFSGVDCELEVRIVAFELPRDVVEH